MSQTETTTSSAGTTEAGLGWVKLLRWATIAALVVVIFINVVAGVIPPLLVFVLLWAGGLFWLTRSTKGPAILLLVTFVAFLLMSGPFIVPSLMAPAGGAEFVTNLLSVLAAIAGILAAVAILRRRHEHASDTPKRVGLLVAALAIVGIAVATFATMGYENPAPQEGDVELAAQDIEFTQTELEAQSGQVGVFVSNADATLHTFTIDELDVNLTIPASKDARVTFEAEPGTYEFYCAPHREDMQGTLTVE